jgi:short-subunit dehydrogenase
MDYFLARGGGHIVGISSVAAFRGNDTAHAYSASKAFISNYMEGLRKKAVKRKIPLAVTDVRPGFVDTEMIEEIKGLFWVSTQEKTARQIFSAIRRRKKRAYITRRWRLVGWLLRWAPDWIFYRV